MRGELHRRGQLAGRRPRERNASGAGVALALDAAGAAHVIYARQSSGALGYATCPTSCTSAANWTVGTADSVLGGNRGDAAALAVDGTQLHASYHDSAAGNLRYATCSASCTDPAQWQSTIVDAGGDVGRLRTSILASGGALHIAYWDAANHALRYATCTATCTTSGSWTSVMVDQGTDLGEYASLDAGHQRTAARGVRGCGAPALRVRHLRVELHCARELDVGRRRYGDTDRSLSVRRCGAAAARHL